LLKSADSIDRRHLRHRIVVIGDLASDMRMSVIGRVPGVILQANYIESLLDQRYFGGLGLWVTGGTSFVFLLIVYMIFEKSAKLGRALFRAVFFWLILALASYIALVH